jgi:hypothetical protein
VVIRLILRRSSSTEHNLDFGEDSRIIARSPSEKPAGQ